MSGGGGGGEKAGARTAFKEAIHLHKYNKDYAQLFGTLSALAKDTLQKKQFLQASAFTTFDRIVLRSFVHHCQNPRYGYGYTSPVELTAGGEALHAVAASALAYEDRKRDDAAAGPHRVLFDGPTWWQQHKAQHPARPCVRGREPNRST